jgi:hypothetical protein
MMKASLGFWSVDQGVPITALLTTPVKKKYEIDTTLSGDIAHGSRNCLERSCATVEEVVAPFLVEGRLKLSARITNVQ